MAVHVKAMLKMQEKGAITFDYGNNIRQVAKDEGVENAFDFPGFVPAYIRPLFCEGKGPFRWAALSGDPEDIRKIDEVLLREFKDDEHLCKWVKMAQEKLAFKDFLPVFVGSDTVIVLASGRSLMTWWLRVNFQHQSLSAAII